MAEAKTSGASQGDLVSTKYIAPISPSIEPPFSFLKGGEHGMDLLDLSERVATELLNGEDEFPDAEVRWKMYEGLPEGAEGKTLLRGTMDQPDGTYAESILLYHGGEVAAKIYPYDNQQQYGLAGAICHAGPVIQQLVSEVKRLRELQSKLAALVKQAYEEGGDDGAESTMCSSNQHREKEYTFQGTLVHQQLSALLGEADEAGESEDKRGAKRPVGI